MRKNKVFSQHVSVRNVIYEIGAHAQIITQRLTIDHIFSTIAKTCSTLTCMQLHAHTNTQCETANAMPLHSFTQFPIVDIIFAKQIVSHDERRLAVLCSTKFEVFFSLTLFRYNIYAWRLMSAFYNDVPIVFHFCHRLINFFFLCIVDSLWAMDFILSSNRSSNVYFK